MFREVVWSKCRLEEMLDYPIRIFTLPNDSYNYGPVIELAHKYYLACVNIEGSPNREGFDLFNIGNYILGSGTIPKRSGRPEELRTQNLSLDFLKDTWLYETTHLVSWNVPQQNKNVTPDYLVERFEKLFDISGGKLWAAKPDDVIDYELIRRNLSIENVHTENRAIVFDVGGMWTVGVVNSFITIRLSGINFISPPIIKYFYNDNIPEAFKEKTNLHNKIEEVIKEGEDWLIKM